MVKVKEKSELVTVNAGENLKKLLDKNFVRPTKHSILLPYFDELEEETGKNFQSIINGMMAAFLTENAIEATEYTDMFTKHIRLFGLRMSKETFLDLVRFFYEVLIKKDQNRSLMKTACLGFGKMMKLSRSGSFGYRDLTLDWKPIYELFLRALNNKIKPDISANLNDVILSFAIFYHPEEHANIWETLLQEMIIGSPLFMEQFMTICRLFLTVEGLSEDDAKKYSVDTWIKPLWDLYSRADMNAPWTSVCMEHISELCFYHPGAYNLSPHYDVIFTKMMRSFELTVRGGKVSVGDGQEVSSNSHLASICVYTIGGPNSSLSHFQRLMQYILVNVHPLNVGDHTEQIGFFLRDFIKEFKNRLKEERLKVKKRRCSSEFYLTDKDIDAVTESIMDLAIMLMFSTTFQDDYQLVHGLTTINRELVTPKLLDHLYSSLTAVSEPHRLTTIIEAFSVIIFEVIRQPDSEYRLPRNIKYDSTWLKYLEEERINWPSYKTGSEVPEVKTHSFTSLRPHAFYIMEVFVNQINVSDVGRTGYIFRTLITLFSSFPLIDISPAIKFHEKEMSEDDKILCFLSKRVPHIVEYTLEKLLDVITCLSVVVPKTSGGEVGASMSNESQKQLGDEETVWKLGIGQLVRVMFERVDEKMRKTLFDRLFGYLKTVEFSNSLASEILSSLVASAIWVSREAYRQYIEFISVKLKNLITDDVRKSRNPPSSVLFYVELSRPLFAATHHMILENEQLLSQVIQILLQCESTNIHKCGTFGVSALLSTLLSIDTEATASPENETFAKPLNEWNPIKYWAKCNDLKETVIRWYIPAKPEVDCAQRLLNKFFPFIQELTKTGQTRETIRRVLNHVMTVSQDIDLFEHPDSIRNISDVYTPFCLPISSSSLGKSCVLEHQIKGPNGENAREMMLQMVESLSKSTHDPVSLIHLSTIAFQCLGKKKVTRFDSDFDSLLTGVYGVLVDSTYGKATKVSQHTMDQMAFMKHVQAQSFHNYETRHPNDFDERILNCLFDFALNDYEKSEQSKSEQNTGSQLEENMSTNIPEFPSDADDSVVEESMRSIRSPTTPEANGSPRVHSNLSHSIVTSTPKSRSVASAKIESSYGSSKSSSHNNDHDRSRSFIENDENAPMTPITKKLTQATDMRSKALLRQRLLRKAMKKPDDDANRGCSSNSVGAWGSASTESLPESSELFNSVLSPIVRTAPRQFQFDSDTFVNIPKVAASTAINDIGGGIQEQIDTKKDADRLENRIFGNTKQEYHRGIVDKTPDKQSAKPSTSNKVQEEIVTIVLDDSDIIDVTPQKPQRIAVPEEEHPPWLVSRKPPPRAPSPEKEDYSKLSYKELVAKKNQVMGLISHFEHLPDKGKRVLRQFQDLDDEVERRKDLGLDIVSDQDDDDDIIVIDDEDEEPKRVAPIFPSGSVMTQNGLLPTRRIVDPVPAVQMDFNAILDRNNKKLMAGKMTDQKYRNVILFTDSCCSPTSRMNKLTTADIKMLFQL
ncbi:hypothetical protein CAEBREN_30827 [Caenorhabditis brenneri]|uniref:Proteasome activator Blm10 middle HEAT repeats region domain-containing protein n=1 Tax=Caenorhabditis brenneri TaxID=135651 RepID=G0NLD6_CAEBE|nr:hypothetical protein CAEBREN_30827 [Caenorhabditis brenneri]